MSRVRDCLVCQDYHHRRARVLAPHIATAAFLRGVAPTVVAVEYLFAVHRRHLAGGSLSTRPSTPTRHRPGGGSVITVKRVCNGCGGDLGDATPAELEAAVAGGPLPDVRVEHGCYPIAGAA